MSPPPLQDKQPRRSVSFDIAADQYAQLIATQRSIKAETGQVVAIMRLAREAFERGLDW